MNKADIKKHPSYYKFARSPRQFDLIRRCPTKKKCLLASSVYGLHIDDAHIDSSQSFGKLQSLSMESRLAMPIFSLFVPSECINGTQYISNLEQQQQHRLGCDSEAMDYYIKLVR